MSNIEQYSNYTREQLVEEYLETKLAVLIDCCGINTRWMPKDVPKDPAYWKAKDKDIHDMHCEIARRYNIDRYDCLWLENIADTDNLYIVDYKFKAIVREAIELLEEAEEKKKRKEANAN